MSAVTASLCSTLMFVLFVSADQKIITAESGQDVTLTCRAPNNNIIVVNWSRADLGDEYALLYRDGHFLTDNQHPSFKNRVDLQDRQMKDGDVSLTLKDVTINDAGTYKCHVFMRETRLWQLSIIDLHVVPPGQTGGNPVWMIGLGLVVVVVVVVVVLIYKKRIKRRKQVGRSAWFSKLKTSPPPSPRSQSCPTRRKTDDQGQKETDDAI